MKVSLFTHTHTHTHTHTNTHTHTQKSLISETGRTQGKVQKLPAGMSIPQTTWHLLIPCLLLPQILQL